MPMGMDDQDWEEREMDRLQEEEARKEEHEREQLEAEIRAEEAHQARIDSGYYNEFDD